MLFPRQWAATPSRQKLFYRKRHLSYNVKSKIVLFHYINDGTTPNAAFFSSFAKFHGPLRIVCLFEYLNLFSHAKSVFFVWLVSSRLIYVLSCNSQKIDTFSAELGANRVFHANDSM